jgi:hypothetical protein
MGRPWQTLLEVSCFVELAFAYFGGHLCIVTANGNLAIQVRFPPEIRLMSPETVRFDPDS